MFEKKKSSSNIEDSIDQPESAASFSSASPPPSGPSSPVATIGPSINIKGEVSGDENLIIQGTIEGRIELKNRVVTIGRSGKVTANINATVVKIEGEVNGDISGKEKVIISKTGRVKGNIITPRMSLEDGAKFKGTIDMDPGEQRRTTETDAAAQPSASGAKKPVVEKKTSGSSAPKNQT